MDKETTKDLKHIDIKSQKEIAELGQFLVEAGVLNITKAKPEEVYSKSPTSTPSPVAPETHIQR